jgi:hypothetical protein
LSTNEEWANRMTLFHQATLIPSNTPLHYDINGIHDLPFSVQRYACSDCCLSSLVKSPKMIVKHFADISFNSVLATCLKIVSKTELDFSQVSPAKDRHCTASRWMPSSASSSDEM